jgi:hypothetical protein
MSGGSKKPAEQKPPINAKDQDEEKFIQYIVPITRCSRSLSVSWSCFTNARITESSSKAPSKRVGLRSIGKDTELGEEVGALATLEHNVRACYYMQWAVSVGA